MKNDINWTAIAVVLGLLLLALVFLNKTVYSSQLEPCPLGTYPVGIENGKFVCKQEPTGCVHGDSLNKDACAKFEAPQQQEQPVSPNPPTNYNWGK